MSFSTLRLLQQQQQYQQTNKNNYNHIICFTIFPIKMSTRTMSAKKVDKSGEVDLTGKHLD